MGMSLAVIDKILFLSAIPIFIFGVILIIILLWRGCCTDSTKVETVALVICILKLLLLLMIIGIHAVLFALSIYQNKNAQLYYIIYLISVAILLTFFSILHYMLHIRQLYSTFMGTIYQVTNKKLIVLSINLTSGAIIQVIGYVLYMAHHDHISFSGLIIMFIGFLIIIFGTIYIEFTFYNNLCSLMVSMRSSIIQQEIQMDDKQMDLLNVVIRKSVLFCMGTGSGIGVFVFAFAALLLDDMTIVFVSYIYNWLFFAISMLCNFLLFKMNIRCYKKICYGCDNGCRKICQHLVQKSMHRASRYDKYDDGYTRL